jgi:hypothetical protein
LSSDPELYGNTDNSKEEHGESTYSPNEEIVDMSALGQGDTAESKPSRAILPVECAVNQVSLEDVVYAVLSYTRGRCK